MDTAALYQHKSGAWLRKGTHDKYVIGQISQYKTLDIQPGCNVLDVGGHIGLFARNAIDRGAGHVLSIEPHPGNCDMFQLNTQAYPTIELVEAAVVSSTSTDATFKLYESATDTSAHSLVSTRGRAEFTVPVVSFKDALMDAQPSVVKLDIEGYEYELFDDILALFPKFHVTSFAIEFHLNRHDWRQRARNFVAILNSMYKPVRVPNITDKAWNATGAWVKY